MPKERPLEKIQDSSKQSNTKFKRTKTLLKSCKQLAILCDLDIDLLIYDAKHNSLTEYSSKPEKDIYYFMDLLDKSRFNIQEATGGGINIHIQQQSSVRRPQFKYQKIDIDLEPSSIKGSSQILRRDSSVWDQQSLRPSIHSQWYKAPESESHQLQQQFVQQQ